MKKAPLMLALLVFSAPLLFKNKLSAAQSNEQATPSEEKSVTTLIREYATCGKECPEKYKDAIVAQIAKIRNISKKQAAALIVLAFLAWKGKKAIPEYLERKRGEKLIPPIETMYGPSPFGQ